MDQRGREEIAAALLGTYASGKPTDPPTEAHPGLTAEDACMTQAVDVPAGRTLAVHFTSLGSVFVPFPGPRQAADDQALRRDRQRGGALGCRQATTAAAIC